MSGADVLRDQIAAEIENGPLDQDWGLLDHVSTADNIVALFEQVGWWSPKFGFFATTADPEVLRRRDKGVVPAYIGSFPASSEGPET